MIMNWSPKTSKGQKKMQKFILEGLVAIFKTTEIKERVPELDEGRIVWRS